MVRMCTCSQRRVVMAAVASAWDSGRPHSAARASSAVVMVHLQRFNMYSTGLRVPFASDVSPVATTCEAAAASGPARSWKRQGGAVDAM